MHEEQFCGEITRTGGESTSGLSIVGLLGAVAGAWVVRLAVVALVSIVGCAHTDIKRGPDDCGTFASSDTGVGIIHVPAGQYERYALACGTERFSRIVAQQRMAVAAGAYEATKRDAVARAAIARTQRDLHALAGEVVQIGDAVGGAEGGAK